MEAQRNQRSSLHHCGGECIVAVGADLAGGSDFDGDFGGDFGCDFGEFGGFGGFGGGFGGSFDDSFGGGEDGSVDSGGSVGSGSGQEDWGAPPLETAMTESLYLQTHFQTETGCQLAGVVPEFV